jgi:hypothetical protein
MRALLFLITLSLPVCACAQDAATQLPPSEALQQALAPFNQARAESGDLTDADRAALTLGIARAARDCEALTATPQTTSAPQPQAEDPKQQLALGRLCIFGQRFEPARATLFAYLALPSPPERETALILLVRAYLGLQNAGSAVAQVLSLMRDYPYDAEIHLAADQAIAGSEALVLDPDNWSTWDAKTLCEDQSAATLPLLQQGKALAGKASSVPVSQLYRDALRCAALYRTLGDPKADDTLQRLATVVTQESLQHTAELATMQAALARAQMLGKPTPVLLLQAHPSAPGAATALKFIPLSHGRMVLAAWTLWSPSANDRIRDLAAAAPAHRVYALTSWTANTGGDDVKSPGTDAAVRAWQRALPPQVVPLIVPDSELQAFHIDQYPAAIVIDNGKVVSNIVLSDEGSVRMALMPIRPKRAAH